MTTIKKFILFSTAIFSLAHAQNTSEQTTDIDSVARQIQAPLTKAKADTSDYPEQKEEHVKHQQQRQALRQVAVNTAKETEKKPQLRDLRGRFTTLSNLLDDLSDELKQSTPDFEKALKFLERIGVTKTINGNTHHFLWKAKDQKNDIHKGCHKPHGAQLKKGSKAAWVIAIKDMIEKIRASQIT